MEKYEVWTWQFGVLKLASRHRLYRAAKSRLDSYMRQGISAELRKIA